MMKYEIMFPSDQYQHCISLPSPASLQPASHKQRSSNTSAKNQDTFSVAKPRIMYHSGQTGNREEIIRKFSNILSFTGRDRKQSSSHSSRGNRQSENNNWMEDLAGREWLVIISTCPGQSWSCFNVTNDLVSSHSIRNDLNFQQNREKNWDLGQHTTSQISIQNNDLKCLLQTLESLSVLLAFDEPFLRNRNSFAVMRLFIVIVLFISCFHVLRETGEPWHWPWRINLTNTLYLLHCSFQGWFKNNGIFHWGRGDLSIIDNTSLSKQSKTSTK